MLISALTHWGFFWANTSVIYIAEIYDNYESLGALFFVSDVEGGIGFEVFFCVSEDISWLESIVFKWPILAQVQRKAFWSFGSAHQKIYLSLSFQRMRVGDKPLHTHQAQTHLVKRLIAAGVGFLNKTWKKLFPPRDRCGVNNALIAVLHKETIEELNEMIDQVAATQRRMEPGSEQLNDKEGYDSRWSVELTKFPHKRRSNEKLSALITSLELSEVYSDQASTDRLWAQMATTNLAR